MALIKCPECGAMISDKATECPKCGYPIKQEGDADATSHQMSADEEQASATQPAYEPEIPRKKGKGIIVALVIVLFCLLAGGGYFAYVKLLKGSVGKDAVVEITPEFIAKVQQYDELSIFSEGLAAVKKGDKWGYIDTKANEVLPFQYDDAQPFSEELAAIRKGKSMGYINAKGEEVIPLKYTDAKPFSDNIAAVCKGDFWGLINAKGEEVLKCSYNQIENFSDGLAAVRQGEELECKWGYVDKQGHMAIPVSIDAKAVGSFSDGLAFVCIDYEKFLVIDTSGKKVFGGTWSEPVEWEHGSGGVYIASILPTYIDGKIYVPTDVEEYTAYDKTGRKGGKIGQKEMDRIERQAAAKRAKGVNAYTIFSNDKSETYRDYKWLEAVLGLKDASGNTVIQPAYNMINHCTVGVVEVSNGVVLVQLEEINGEVSEGFNGMLASEKVYYYGYADLKGHDTFTREVKTRCEASKRRAVASMQEQSAMETAEEQSYNDMDESGNGGYDWLQGTWDKSITLSADIRNGGYVKGSMHSSTGRYYYGLGFLGASGGKVPEGKVIVFKSVDLNSDNNIPFDHVNVNVFDESRVKISTVEARTSGEFTIRAGYTYEVEIEVRDGSFSGHVEAVFHFEEKDE